MCVRTSMRMQCVRMCVSFLSPHVCFRIGWGGRAAWAEKPFFGMRLPLWRGGYFGFTSSYLHSGGPRGPGYLGRRGRCLRLYAGTQKTQRATGQWFSTVHDMASTFVSSDRRGTFSGSGASVAIAAWHVATSF